MLWGKLKQGKGLEVLFNAGWSGKDPLLSPTYMQRSAGNNIILSRSHLCWNVVSFIIKYGTSLVVQWLRIRLPMQGTRVRSLVWEDPTCCGATKPVCHNYWACVLQLLKPVCSRAQVPQLLSPCAATTEAWAPRACAPQQEKLPQWEACALQWRVAPARRY